MASLFTVFHSIPMVYLSLPADMHTMLNEWDAEFT